MRVAGATVFAYRFAAQADTVQPLIDDYAITGGKIFDFRANFFDDTTNLMPKNLRIDIEWNRLPIFVRVVVGVTGKDVGVGPAKAHGGNAHHNFMWARARQ